MKCMIIKSNHGNHSGHNRTWSEISQHPTIGEAKKELRKYAAEDGEQVDSDGMAYRYDHLTKVCIVTKKHIPLFNGGCNGYLPTFISDYFKSK